MYLPYLVIASDSEAISRNSYYTAPLKLALHKTCLQQQNQENNNN